MPKAGLCSIARSGLFNGRRRYFCVISTAAISMPPLLAEEIELVGPLIRVVAVYLGIAANMAATCCVEREEASSKTALWPRSAQKARAGPQNILSSPDIAP